MCGKKEGFGPTILGWEWARDFLNFVRIFPRDRTARYLGTGAGQVVGSGVEDEESVGEGRGGSCRLGGLHVRCSPLIPP
jgi:hypothetical protein